MFGLHGRFLAVTICLATQLTFSQEKFASENEQPLTVKNEQPVTVADALRQHHIALTNEAPVEALQNPDAEIRGLAATQLAYTNVRIAIPDIVSAVNKETSLLTRANIASALTVLGDETGFSVLKNMCNSADVPGHFRTLAARYLLDVNDASCLDAVLNILQADEEPSSQMAALDILPRFKNVSEADFRKIYALVVKDLTNPDPTVRFYANNTLAALAQMEANMRRLREKKNP